MFCVSDRRLRSLGKANSNTSQATANAIVHAMQWLKTALIDDIIKSLALEYYKADEKTY
jgi:sulfonate transport system substrate-binding protein